MLLERERDLARVPRGAHVEVERLLVRVELPERVVRAEGVRLDDVGAGLEVAAVDPLDRFRVRAIH